ncbi:A24 family peptidase [Prosthecomicrobium sp. N25]|uniref:A24 family peptidase n=1 Tax=Prosthecomicrobium sp. N25 TaxID=3129254 RepID=UPI003078173B
MLEAVTMVVFPLLLAYAAATDFLTMTIANRVSLLLIAFFAILAPFAGLGLAAVGWHLAAGLAVFAVGYICFALGWMGGGDVKFGAAIALWLGWGQLMDFALLFSVFGGLLTVLTLVVSRLIRPLPLLQVGFLAEFPEKRTVPYGIALAAAGLFLYPGTPFVRALL